MKYLTRLFSFLLPQKKFRWDTFAGEITAIVFVVIVCWILNQYPNAYLYSKVGTEEAVIMLVNGFLLGQIARKIGQKD